MNLIYGLGVIFVVTFIGELVYQALPLPIPASVYGLLIMLICLQTKIIKLNKIKDASDLLLKLMPLMFIPASVGLINIWGEMQKILLPLAVIIALTTVIVMVATGKVTQYIVLLEKRGNKHDRNIK
ncbi:CidA/LrgA family protein [Proteinivorax hydrogeniformans]|uniref:CidA/LrgA family protein n=1 Tax=Proteinivorax hydrogeniformans TaxID=1826727 RepID=A0AAU8HRR7_9FIRM